MSESELLPEPIVGVKAVEDAAITFVIEQERRHGREARDTRHKRAAADVESSDRIIEVKAVGGWLRSSGSLPLEARQVEEARRNPQRFYVYIIENVTQGDPSKFELRVLHGDRLRAALDNAKERRYFEVPIRVAEYRELPRLDDA